MLACLRPDLWTLPELSRLWTGFARRTSRLENAGKRLPQRLGKRSVSHSAYVQLRIIADIRSRMLCAVDDNSPLFV